jgi:hypothetical protein
MIVWTRNSWQFLTLLVGVACSGGDRDGIPGLAGGGSGFKTAVAASPPSAGGDDSAGGDVGASPDGESGSGGGDGGDGGASGFAGVGAAGETTVGGAPWMEPEHRPLCVAAGGLRNPQRLAISSSDVDQLGGISADELVIAWTVVADDRVTLHYARRAEVEAELAAPETLVIPAASDSVSLSADGLRVVYVNADRKGFGQLVRAAADLPFELVDGSDFALIHESTQLFAADEYVGDPVLGPDNLSFIYSRYGAGRRTTLLLTKRFSSYAPWPEGNPLPVTPELEATELGRQRPTGVSLDLESLFLWDASASAQRVATLAHDTRTYDLSLDLGDARGAAPNTACSRVFYDFEGDLWQADFGTVP